MKRVFMTRHFSRWLRQTDLTIDALCNAIREMEHGLIDANLGGGIVKKRVALPGRGKSGSTRVLVATNFRDRWFLVFGFEKNDRENISGKELNALKALAADLMRLGSAQIISALITKRLQEICHEN
jgi:hypothetical protein